MLASLITTAQTTEDSVFDQFGNTYPISCLAIPTTGVSAQDLSDIARNENNTKLPHF